MKYQEALDELEGNAVQWKANKKWNKEHGFFIDDVGIDEMIAYSKLLQELVDKEIELESRKDKLVVGSEWECVAECRAPSQLFKKGQIVSVTSIFIEETVWLFYKHFSEMLKKEYEDETNMPKDQFLLCFAPKGEK